MNTEYITQRFAPILTDHLLITDPIDTSNETEISISQFAKRYGYAMDILDPNLYLKRKISPFGVIYNTETKDVSPMTYMDNRLKYQIVDNGELVFLDIGELLVWTFFRILPISVRCDYHICKDGAGVTYVNHLEFTFKAPQREIVNRRTHYRIGTMEFIKTDRNLLVSKEGALYDLSRNRFIQQYIYKNPDKYIRSVIYLAHGHYVGEVSRLTWRGWTEHIVPRYIEIHSDSGIEIETRIQHLRCVNQAIRSLPTPTSREGMEKVQRVLKKNSEYLSKCRNNLISNGIEI